MKKISVYDEGTRYELTEQDVIELHTKLRLMHEAIVSILMDYADLDPSTVKTLTDIDAYVTDVRDVLTAMLRLTSLDAPVERAGAIEPNKYSVEKRFETVKSSLEDAIADVDCSLSDRIDEHDEKIAEMYEFYENFPSDWSLEKQLKELAEETVKAAIEPIEDRLSKLEKAFDAMSSVCPKYHK